MQRTYNITGIIYKTICHDPTGMRTLISEGIDLLFVAGVTDLFTLYFHYTYLTFPRIQV